MSSASVGKMCNSDTASCRRNSINVCTPGVICAASANGRKPKVVALHGRSLTRSCSKARRSSTPEESVARASGGRDSEMSGRYYAGQQSELEFRAIVLGDGSRSWQLHLHKGLSCVSAGTDVRVEQFLEVDLYPIKKKVVGSSMITLPARQLVRTMRWKERIPRACTSDGLPGSRTRAQSSQVQGKVMLEGVLTFYRKFAGLVVLLGGRGGRDENLKLQAFHATEAHCTEMVTMKMDCVCVAVSKEVKQFKGEDGVCEAKEKLRIHHQ